MTGSGSPCRLSLSSLPILATCPAAAFVPAGKPPHDQSAYSPDAAGAGPQPISRPAAGAISRILPIELVDHHSKAGPAYRRRRRAPDLRADAQSSEVLEQATKLKWVQALGTGVDNLIDQADSAQGCDRHQYSRHPWAAGVGSRARRHAGAGARSAACGTCPGRRGNGGASRRSCCTTRRSEFLASAPLPKPWRRNARPSA